MSFSFLNAPKDSKELLMADVTRVLSLLSGSLWLDEISGEVNGFRQTLDRPSTFDDKELKTSVEALKALNLVTTKEGVTAGQDKPRANLLVGLIRTDTLQDVLRSDADIRKYRTIASSYMP